MQAITMLIMSTELRPIAALWALVPSFIVYFSFLAVYRLYLSPLSRFPGPKLAALTGLYEFYHDYWLDGKFVFEIERMHKKYGPIVRINPREISIHDAEFYNEVYVTDNRRRSNNHDLFCKGIGFDGSFLLTVDHDLHRQRRKPFEPFFSRKGISSLQSMLAEVALHLESRLREMKGRIVRLDHAFSAFSGDVIGRICLDSDDVSDRLLNDVNFAPDWYDITHRLIQSIPLFTRLSWLIRFVTWMPKRLLIWAFPQGNVFRVFTERARQDIHRAMIEVSDKEKPSSSLFHHIVRDGTLGSENSEERLTRLTREAQVMLASGTVTTARTIGFASYYILSRPSIRERLQHELKDTMSSWPQRVPSWAELEQLPFLQAIIKESLRLNYGVMHRLPRIFPDESLQYKQYTIPAGVPVGMSAYLMHSNPAVYPSPDQFIPERWIGDVDPALHKSWVPFCRGSRNCLGMNLALAEMSLVLAVLYRPNGPPMELFETDESDVKQKHDFIIPLPKKSTKGIRALVR